MVVLASVAATAPAMMTAMTRSSWSRTFIAEANAPEPRTVKRAAPATSITATTITITYERSEALCSGGRDHTADRVQRRHNAGVQLLGPMCGPPPAAADWITQHVCPADSQQRQHAEHQCGREPVPGGQRHGERRTQDHATRSGERGIEDPGDDTGENATQSQRERRYPEGPRRLARFFTCRCASKRQHASQKSRQTQENACEHSEDQQPRRPPAVMKQCLVRTVLSNEAERQRHPRHRQRGRTTGDGRHGHRAA